MSILHPCLWPLLITAATTPASEPKYLSAVQVEPKYSPQLEKILDKWGDKMSQIQSAEVKVSEYRYDSVFSVETRGDCHLCFTSPNRIHYEIRHPEFASGEQSTRKNRHGKKYQLRRARAIIWAFDGTELSMTSEKGDNLSLGKVDSQNPRKISVISPFSKERSKSRPLQYMMPIFLWLDASELRRLYSWKLLKETKSNYWLQASPRDISKVWYYLPSTLIINKATWLSEAMRFIDASGNYEVVYVAHDWQVRLNKKNQR